jgi:hypothetical protein
LAATTFGPLGTETGEASAPGAGAVGERAEFELHPVANPTITAEIIPDIFGLSTTTPPRLKVFELFAQQFLQAFLRLLIISMMPHSCANDNHSLNKTLGSFRFFSNLSGRRP